MRRKLLLLSLIATAGSNLVWGDVSEIQPWHTQSIIRQFNAGILEDAEWIEAGGVDFCKFANEDYFVVADHELEFNEQEPTLIQKTTGGSYTGDVVVPQTVSYDGKEYDVAKSYSFSYCPELKSVKFPKTMTGIYGIYSCPELESVQLPENLKELKAFMNCKKLKNLELPPTLITLIGINNCPEIEELKVPETVTTLYGISYNENLTKINIPGNLKALDGLTDCPNLVMDLVLPESLETFRGICNIGITSLNIPPKIKVIPWRSCNNLPNLKELDMGDNITEIAQDSFNGCTSLESVKIPSAMQKMTNAFRDCTSLREVEFPEREISMYNCFTGCTALKEVELPGCEISMDWCFKDCTALREVELPDCEISMERCFFGCTALEKVVCNSLTVYDLDETNFLGVDFSKCVLYVPGEVLKFYQKAKGWKRFQTILPIESTGIEEITPDTEFSISGGTLTVNTPSGAILLTPDGKTAATFAPGETTLTPPHGIYLLTDGRKTIKIAL